MPRFHKLFCYLSILGASYLTALNFSSYTIAEEAERMHNEIIKGVELSFGRMTLPQQEEAIELLKEDLDNNLTSQKYKSHSLFRIIGNFFKLLGVMMLLRLRKLGFHLFLAGSIFIIITGFITMGTGPIGWSFNMFYIIAGLIFNLFYYSNYKAYS